MAKVKKKSPRKSPSKKRPASAPDANLLVDLLKWAKAAGADSADAVYVNGESISVAQRMGEREKLESSEGRDLGLCVFVGQRQAFVSSTDFAVPALRTLAQRAVDMARAVPEDPVCGIAPEELLARSWPDLDLDDKRRPSARSLLAMAKEAEDAARAVKGVTNSEGAEASWGRSSVVLAASNGFSGGYRRSGFSLSCSVLGGEGTGMERDYEWSSAVHLEDLMAPARVGRNAGKFVVRRLNPRKAQSARVPVVYDRRVSGGLIGHLASAINGRAVARGTSFLKDKMGEKIFADGIRILDNPRRLRGLGSRPFDAEGLPTKRYAVIDDGHLTTWLLDLARRTRHVGPALAHHLELLPREGQAPGRRADRRHQERALHHRPHRLWRQRRHRRLQPSRVGLLDRERQARLAGEGHHRGGQSQGHVFKHDAGQRPAVQGRHQCADGANRRVDRRRLVIESAA